MSESTPARAPNGHFAEKSFEAVYDALGREVKRIAELRASDQLAVAAALTAAEKAVSAALTAAKEAVNKAEASQQRVNEGQNEFRAQLKDQAASLMPRNESELITTGLREQVGDLRSRLDVGPLGMKALQTSSDTETGRRAGSSSTLATIISVAVAAAVIGGTIVGIILNLMGAP